MTERLYYTDSHLREFEAAVLSCAPAEKGFAVVLDRTAFFPEGGGQAADTGLIGGMRVLDAQESGDNVVHRTDGPVETGGRVLCRIDWDARFRRMQNHSGEHVVSGTVHRLFGFDNVGFHMGGSTVTLDFNGEIPTEDIRRVETLANRAVYENILVKTAFPAPEELAAIDYRSKLELTENVRIVTIEGVDCCACCAPHVSRTGEIGIIKILDAMRHRGGTRMTVVCGSDALLDYNLRCENISDISETLSAKQFETAAAVRRVLAELEAVRVEAYQARKTLLEYKISALKPSEGALCLFEEDMDMLSLRLLVNAGMKLAPVCAAFSGPDGDYKYIIGSEKTDLRAAAGEINAAIDGQGGGSASMIQGRSGAAHDKIVTFFNGKKF